MKPAEWFKAKKKLIPIYKEHGITTCEGQPLNPRCMRTFALSFHHLDKRSSGLAENTFEGTRLLCAECHQKADQRPGFYEFNEKLRALR